MSPCYWDTSALLALLFKEASTPAARRLAAGGGLPGYTSFFTLIEMESAYARRLEEGSLSASRLSELRLEAQRLERALGLIWPDREIAAESRRMILELGLRPGDALQLASAAAAAQGDSSPAFASLDEKLNRAAQAAGLSLAWER